MSKVYCTAPWNGVTVRENGDVKTCCQGGVVLGNLSNQPIQEILKSQKLLDIQRQLLSGEADQENCKVCIHQEKNSGLAALRQHYLNHYPEIYSTPQLKNLDIRWNNSCNLGCMYCSPKFSSVWQGRLNVQKTSSPVKEYQDDLLEFVLNNAEQIKEIMLVGGEPMLMKQNYKLFAQVPDHTRISIITNLSYDLEKLPCISDLLDRPAENTIWSVSLENTGPQFEYVRNGASWAQVEKNLKFLDQHWPGNASALMVYSMFNAFEVGNVFDKLHSLGIKKFTFQSYFGPAAVDVFSMPKAIQQRAYQALHQAKDLHYSKIHHEDHELYHINNLDFLLEKLRSGADPVSPVTKTEFYNQIKWYDQWNAVSYQELWPDVIDSVEQHLL